MKDYLTNLIERKQAELADLKKRSDESQDLAEVRSIGEMLEKITAEITEANEQLNKLSEEERNEVPADAELRNANVVSTFGGVENMEQNNMEYRQAFMDYILRGVKIPVELRQDANTLTTDVSAVIPTEVVNRIVEKMDNVGMILPLINKTNYKGGVAIPVSTVKPVASWVGEGAGSDRQKKTTGVSITFTYHKLRCEISMSMEVATMALSAFEAKFVENVAKAMVYAIENAVINGDGSGKPSGILAETPVTGQAVPTAVLSYAKICEIEGVVPEEYDATAKWCMNKKTFMKFVGLVDADGQPIARVNYGLAGKAERTILGREVVICPYVADNATFIFDFADYTLNTIYDMGITKKQDWETEDMLTKAVMSVDGKVVDKHSLVTYTITPSI